MTVRDLGAARDVAIAAVREAGALLRAGAAGRPAAVAKGTTGDLVTALDVEAEKIILGRLATAFPHDQVFAEESGAHGAEGTWNWWVDPLDGTNNVAIGLAVYVVGVALCQDREPVLGVVHDPVADQTWSALRGGGAVGPYGVLHAQPRTRPAGDRLAWTQGHGVERTDPVMRAVKAALETRASRLLQLWAPLLSWVMLARGDIDGFIGYRAEAVDLSAGLLIAAEAGLAVHDLDGAPFDRRVGPADRPSFVAAHPAHIPRLLATVRQAIGKERPTETQLV